MRPATEVTILGWPVDTSEPDEPRVRDVDLAERAGMPQPRNVRSIIRKRRATLEAYGPLSMRTRCVRIEKRGRNVPKGTTEEREVTEYWLTEHQAHHLAFYLRTPKALELQVEIVKVFVAFRRGELGPGPVKAVPIVEVHGSRIGETHVRDELVGWCRLAAASLTVTIHRIHGALRRQYKVASAYHLSLSVWPTARAFLEGLAMKRLLLEGPIRPPTSRLSVHGVRRERRERNGQRSFFQ